MKKYHIADLLTLSRVFFTVAIVLLTINNAPLELTFTVFCIGELTDALDGPFAKLYPYPEVPKKHRFWREGNFPKIFDTGTDIALGVSFLVFIFMRVNQVFATAIFCSSVSIGFFVTKEIRSLSDPRFNEAVDKLISDRRFLYATSIFVLIIGTTFLMSLSWFWKVILVWLESAVAFSVFMFKHNSTSYVYGYKYYIPIYV